ncbi:hypothetical protein D0860_05286 [Hortaea werneckii]|uniref:Autophagy-related protein 9 n=1 Tax=Hortaea werneckii TaxID=91943 RepID=A0A3M7H253_HORWE|nr:hypothetical protein D0860_05286 [Hortaea werneckii]
MMSSRVLSRLLPVAEGDVSMSVYDGVRHNNTRPQDLEAQYRRSSDEPFRDEDDEDEGPEAFIIEGRGDREPTESATISPEVKGAEQWLGKGGKNRTTEDEDVPTSLLLEARDKRSEKGRPPQTRPDSSEAKAEAQWRAAQQHQRIHGRSSSRPSTRYTTQTTATASFVPKSDPQAEAMWLYTNASSLDAFLLEVYEYFAQHGVWSILLARIIKMLTELFVFSFATFLTTCIDYKKVPASKSTSEVMIPKCMAKAPWWKNLAIFVFIIYWCLRAVTYVSDIRRLFRMHDFFLYVLGIDDQDIQTVSWVRVVDGLVKLQNANVATAQQGPAVKKYVKYSKPQQRMNAESIANRLMRQDNYYVALYNKDILDFTLPLPFIGTRQFYSKSLEWAINACLTNFIFFEEGNIRPFAIDIKNRQVLVQTLQNRFRFAAISSIVVAPFNIVRFCIMYFFRYYTEFTRNPSKVSARSFTPFAEWKIREVNELEHLFQRRLKQASPFADEYLKQFPKDKTDQACRFVAFISGAIAAVLALATLFDPELFLGFEVTPGRTAVFWLTVMVGVFGVAHGALPDENEVHDPVLHLKEVLLYIHHMPAHWKDRLHSNEVRAEFSAMYQMKILIFIEEILSLVVAPWILLRNSGECSERLIDFFREQTVHVDGIGYQCNYAVFGFKKDPNAENATDVLQEPDGLRDDYYGLKDDKMEASMQNFLQMYSTMNKQRRRGRGGQPFQMPPTFPSALSPPPPPHAERGDPQHRVSSESRSRPAALGKRSGIIDPRQQILPQRSPRNEAAHPSSSSRRPHRLRPAAAETGRRSGSSALHHEVSQSTMIREDSELDDDFNHPELAERETDETETEEEGDGAAKPAGVLGMLQQFSKAHMEKGAGVV